MKRILVVDDSELARNFHCYLFGKAGFAVSAASDGAEGLDKLGSEKIDLVVTDLHMSGMDGVEMTRRIRSAAQYDEVPVMVLTTESRDQTREASLRAGANLFLSKPSEPQQILDSARMLLGVKQGE